MARAIAKVALKYIDDLIVSASPHYQNELPSDLAAAVIFKARLKVFKCDSSHRSKWDKAYTLLKDAENIWPDELVFLTRSQQDVIDRILKRKQRRSTLKISDLVQSASS